MTRNIAVGALADLVTPGELVYVPGGVTVPTAFIQDLQSDPQRSQGLRMLTSISPGLPNPLDMERLHASAVVTGLFMQPGLTQAQRSGRFRMMPMSFGGLIRHMREEVDLDLLVVQVSPPNAQGECSLGPSVEFSQLALSKARRVLALINPNVPHYKGSVSIPYERFDYVSQAETTLPEYRTDDDAPTRAAASHIATLIGDGSTLQMGLGKVPTALARILRDRRGLRMFSGMVSDGLMDLSNAGALDKNYEHTCCVVAGSQALYRWASEFDGLRVASCEVTHSPRTLSGLDRFIAVNSALEVDLLGQCNLELADGRAISGAGGAPDFARAARLSPGGCSIVALNASYNSRSRGLQSRIVPRLGEPGLASLARVDVDCIVTEFGVADLRGKSVHERAEALIAVAAEEFRDGLKQAWAETSARL
ncbi:MAG: acetyl-CoA hydrolase/transferase C-terminal domain-containing protein [Burkholderiales bacterium]